MVAVEVRRLAQSAAEASSEVKVLIEQSAGEVTAGSKLVAEATQKLVDMLGSVKESADLIKEITALPEPRPLESRIPLWSHWATLVAIIVLLGIFWTGRKLNGAF